MAPKKDKMARLTEGLLSTPELQATSLRPELKDGYLSITDFTGVAHSAQLVPHTIGALQFITEELVRFGRDEGPVVLIFANANEDFVKKKISPYLKTWNFRSRNYISILFPGYDSDIPSDLSGSVIRKQNTNPQALFNAEYFTAVVEDFERSCSFRYAGDTPVLVCRAFLNYDDTYQRRVAMLDLSSIVVFALQAAIRDKVIKSVDAFLETVIQAAKANPEGYAHLEIGKIMRNSALRGAFIDQIASRFKGVEKAIAARKYFRVLDATRSPTG